MITCKSCINSHVNIYKWEKPRVFPLQSRMSKLIEAKDLMMFNVGQNRIKNGLESEEGF